jgi:hypothetical protein
LSAEDIEWIVPGEDWPLASTHRGHAGLENLLQKANETVETSYPEPPLRGDTQDARTRAGPGPWCCAPGAAHTVKPRPRGSHRSIRSHSRSANSQTGPSRSSARRVPHRRLSPTPDARGYLGGSLYFVISIMLIYFYNLQRSSNPAVRQKLRGSQRWEGFRSRHWMG